MNKLVSPMECVTSSRVVVYARMTILGCLLAGCASSTTLDSSTTGLDFESGASFVVVDQSEPAFTVFAGVATDTDEEALEEIRSKISNREKVSMLAWAQFAESVDTYARSVIVRNEYPNFRVVDGLTCLVGTQPSAPWGLTWNGGIALTFNDYQHVRRSYELYKADPAAYRPIDDPRSDPVNPGGFLPFFGCVL